ncbi:MAG: 30S ribosomal protein S4 [Candidatus Altiarchaeota archaeon]|nr:30S ribosomal protein S4 [Candidatus Altiarchaeota archaeon]
MRKIRRTYDRPFKRWDAGRIKEEKVILSTYGLKNKKEVWKAKSTIRSLRQRARQLFTSDKGKDELFKRVKQSGFITGDFGVDDVLGLNVESVLERRLQTLVYRKGYAKTVGQARQLITHGHIFIDDRVVTIPGYMVNTNEDSRIIYNPNSPIAREDHPIKQAEKPESKKSEKIEEPKKEKKDGIPKAKQEKAQEVEEKKEMQVKQKSEEKQNKEEKKQELKKDGGKGT